MLQHDLIRDNATLIKIDTQISLNLCSLCTQYTWSQLIARPALLASALSQASDADASAKDS